MSVGISVHDACDGATYADYCDARAERADIRRDNARDEGVKLPVQALGMQFGPPVDLHKHGKAPF